eukprot:TRINITY_DN9160_c0_g1_i1.p1 TRINITY_DN9160_c0_g1~~TRINITY_DN9160_c0_g1_i1.p1  ORF type:complete len:163 (+),score=19.41 TRINITY_DN9160_c0_g1_i1:313-801(+)
MAGPLEVIRVKTDEHFKQYMGVRFTVFTKEQGVLLEEEVDEYDGSGTDVASANERAAHFLVLVDAMPAGAGRVIFPEGDEKYCKVTRIATLREFRRKGVANAVMAAIHDVAQAKGYSICKLAAQLDAVPFYERLGYEVVPPGTIFLDARIQHQWMERAVELK